MLGYVAVRFKNLEEHAAGLGQARCLEENLRVSYGKSVGPWSRIYNAKCNLQMPKYSSDCKVPNEKTLRAEANVHTWR